MLSLFLIPDIAILAPRVGRRSRQGLNLFKFSIQVTSGKRYELFVRIVSGYLFTHIMRVWEESQ